MIAGGGREGEKEMNGIQISSKQTSFWNLDYISTSFQLIAKQLFSACAPEQQQKIHKVLGLPGDNTMLTKRKLETIENKWQEP